MYTCIPSVHSSSHHCSNHACPCVDALAYKCSHAELHKNTCTHAFLNPRKQFGPSSHGEMQRNSCAHAFPQSGRARNILSRENCFVQTGTFASTPAQSPNDMLVTPSPVSGSQDIEKSTPETAQPVTKKSRTQRVTSDDTFVVADKPEESEPAAKQRPAEGSLAEAATFVEDRGDLPSQGSVDVSFAQPNPSPAHDPADFNNVMAQVEEELRAIADKTQANESAAADAKVRTRALKFQEQLAAAAQAGNFEARSPLGQQFARELEGADLEDWKNLDTDAARRAFRLNWAKRELSKLTVSKQHLQSWKQANSTHGEYLSFGAIAVAYGYAATPKESLASAGAYCKKCSQLGGRWVMKEQRSDTLLFLHLKKELREEMVSAWHIFETFVSESSTGQAQETTQPARKTKCKAKAESSPTSKAKDDAGVAKRKGAVDSAMANMSKIKSRYLSVSSKAESLKDTIKTEVAWSWANNIENLGAMEAALHKMRDEAKVLNVMMILQQDNKDLKAAMGLQVLHERLTEFCKLDQHVKSLEGAYAKLLRMHREHNRT